VNSEFIERIESPTAPQQRKLFELGRGETEERLEGYDIDVEELDEATLTRLNYTYYHNWEENDPDFMFLVRDPGTPGDHVVSEIVNIRDTTDPIELINIYQRIGAQWLMKRDYATFIKTFLDVFEEEDLIDIPDPWWEYVLNGSFFDDFYMTDVVKYRVDQDLSDTDIQNCFTEYLFDEIEDVDPNLIFAFGKTPWLSLRNMLGTVRVDDGESTQASITEAQGSLYRTTKMPGEQVHVVPFMHMSPHNYPSKVTIPEFEEMLKDSLYNWKTTH